MVRYEQRLNNHRNDYTTNLDNVKFDIFLINFDSLKLMIYLTKLRCDKERAYMWEILIIFLLFNLFSSIYPIKTK